ncbi:helicase-related protein [Cryobacterium sp. RTS3]|uniref:helicase-related protein n=1 Tax=Cryobacterium sp. RTS3 TaxID=3048643 RepID=UPI002B236C1E|nr:helicase-related protein [Cryobacterium sp. RTS3]MEB0000680.1 helicase-related protein [Cryobacterium sp. RTS3]
MNEIEPNIDFATNRPNAMPAETVGGALDRLLKYRLEAHKNAPELWIATAYFNPGGFSLLKDSLGRVTSVRLLLGSEPDPDGPDGVRKKLRRTGTQTNLRRVLKQHEERMFEDRNLTGFTAERDSNSRALVSWLRSNPGVEVRRYTKGFLHGKAFIIPNGKPVALSGSSNFTYAGLALNNELNVGQSQGFAVDQVKDWFTEQWDKSTSYDLAAIYEEVWEPHDPETIFLKFLWELYGSDLDELGESKKTRLSLTEFQADGVWRAKRILDRRRGVIIADEVGLGKTYLAGELIKEAVDERRQKVLVICPATLRDSTWKPLRQKWNIHFDVVSFDEAGVDHKLDDRIQNPDEYSLVVVDEAHNLRNASTLRAENVRKILGGSVPKDLVLLTATPVNNSLLDLKALVGYFLKNDAALADVGIPSIDRYFARALAEEPDDLTPELLFDLLSQVSVRRTRSFVKKYYAGNTVEIRGQKQEIVFPTPRVKRVEYDLEPVLPGFFDDFARALGAKNEEAGLTSAGVILDAPGQVLSMARYVPSQFLWENQSGGEVQYQARNAGLLRSALLKRFESSWHSFAKTLEVMIRSQRDFLSAIERGYVLIGDELREWAARDSDEALEGILENSEDEEHRRPVSLFDIDKLVAATESDISLLGSLLARLAPLTWREDPKIDALFDHIGDIAYSAELETTDVNQQANKRKILLFTYYSDTAEYIEAALTAAMKEGDVRLEKYNDRIALVSGSNRHAKRDAVIGFAPETASENGELGDVGTYDLLVSTDVLAEGVNLQQARHVINYDLPWNPMRLVQRHGRVDRIGSKHTEIFLWCFFPAASLEALLDLEALLQRKMKHVQASFGSTEVLPGMGHGAHDFSELKDEIERLRAEDTSLFTRDDLSASASVEEFRKRLQRALEHDGTRKLVTELPWTSGAAVMKEDPKAKGFAFCARVGDWDTPFLRFVPLAALVPVETSPQRVLAKKLDVLLAADPAHGTAVAVDDETRQLAMQAWSLAQVSILEEWEPLTDSTALELPVRKTMRDAAALVRKFGNHLGPLQDELAKRIEAPLPKRIEDRLRDVLRTAGGEMDKVDAISLLADETGLQIPEQIEPYPVIKGDGSDIYLVTWLAVV